MDPTRSIARNWRLYAAVGIATLMLGGAQAEPVSSSGQPQSDRSLRQPPASPKTPVNTTPGRTHRPCEHGGNPDSTDPNCREAFAAEESAKFAKLSFYVAVAAVLAALGQIIALVITIRQTRTAVSAAQRSAKAAEESAGSLPTVERAHVYPEITHQGATGSVIATAIGNRDAVLRGPDGKQIDLTAEVSFKIINFGKTPAVLTGVSAFLGVVPFDFDMIFPIEDPVLGSGDETRVFRCPMTEGITPEQGKKVVSHTAHVAFIGVITFLDIWGKQWETKFDYGWDIQARNFILRSVQTRGQD